MNRRRHERESQREIVQITLWHVLDAPPELPCGRCGGRPVTHFVQCDAVPHGQQPLCRPCGDSVEQRFSLRPVMRPWEIQPL